MADTEKKVTAVEYFGILKGYAEEAGDTDAMAFCDTKIEQLVSKADKAKAKAAERRAATDELGEQVYATLSEVPQTPQEIADAIGGDVTKAKVVSRIAKLIADGKAVKSQNEDKKVVYTRA